MPPGNRPRTTCQATADVLRHSRTPPAVASYDPADGPTLELTTGQVRGKTFPDARLGPCIQRRPAIGGNNEIPPPSVALIGAGAVAATIAQAQAPTQPASAGGFVISADEIARVVVGKTCTTKAGAKFTFTEDGHYAYDGLWTNQGHYSVNDGSLTVLLDSGLEREFAVSRQENVFYMEETALSCG